MRRYHSSRDKLSIGMAGKQIHLSAEMVSVLRVDEIR
jgi:hypothetical protein